MFVMGREELLKVWMGLVDQNIATWNQIADWLRQVEALRSAARGKFIR
jgi:hypothetical protein